MKKFDCVELQHKGGQHVAEQLKAMTVEQQQSTGSSGRSSCGSASAACRLGTHSEPSRTTDNARIDGRGMDLVPRGEPSIVFT
jgi:hypothetical protein